MKTKYEIFIIIILFILLIVIIYNWRKIVNSLSKIFSGKNNNSIETKMGRGGVVDKPGFVAISGCEDGERCCADKDGDYVCVRGWWTYKYFNNK